MSSAEVTLADATALTRHGWELLCQGRCQEAIEEFSRAIKLDENFAEAYNNRSIGKQIAGEDAADDASVADALTMHDAEAQIKLRQQRKWMCVGYNARGEPEGEKIAADADFLISFASPDRDENNRILQELKTGVYYDGSLRPVTFCTDKSLGMGLHINEGQEMKRWNPIFADLDQPRQPGEYPPWFKHYKKAAEKTRHGLLILQLTDSYLKSKACRWEFGYVRKPELVHVYVPGGDASPGRIVKWEELMDDAELCRQLFREALNHMFPANLDAEDPSKDATSGTLMRLEKMAETAEEQEHQAWCELPFRQLAYSFAKKSFAENSAKAMASAHELLLVYLETGFAAMAKNLGKDLLETMERTIPQGPAVATLLTHLSNAHGKLGEYSQQKDLLERALKIKEQHYGKEHPSVAVTLTNLASAHGSLGDYGQQKDLLERALKIKEQHYGKEHPSVAVTLTNLASAHGSLGDYGQQKDLLERALKIKEQQYGKEHPEVAIILTSLGNAHGSLGHYRLKKDLLERALKINEQHYGKDHPEVAVTLISLGNAHGIMGDYGLKKDLLERALKIKEQHYGKEHPEVAIALTNLGNAHGRLGDYRLMKDMLERALKVAEQHYGKEHPFVAIPLTNLGNVHGVLGNYGQQKELLERALKIKEQHLGKEHPEVADTLTNLSNFHGSLGDSGQQKDLLERALNVLEQHYGKEHPRVAVTLTNLGNAHGSLSNYRLKQDLLERALNINEQHYGKEHPEVAVTLYNLGLAYYQDTGDCARAKECVERALKIFVQHSHPYANRAETALHGLAQVPFQGSVVQRVKTRMMQIFRKWRLGS